MSYYDVLRADQHAEERRQDRNDKKIHKHFVGSLKPKDKQIINKLKEAAGSFH